MGKLIEDVKGIVEAMPVGRISPKTDEYEPGDAEFEKYVTDELYKFISVINKKSQYFGYGRIGTSQMKNLKRLMVAALRKENII